MKKLIILWSAASSQELYVLLTAKYQLSFNGEVTGPTYLGKYLLTAPPPSVLNKNPVRNK